MFGLDLVSIISAAIGGALGGALGAGIGSFFKAQNIKIGIVVALALIGGRALMPLIEPQVEAALGTTVRGNQFEATYDNEVVPELKKIPALNRMFKDDPAVEKAFRDKARVSYEKGGAKQLLEDAPGIGAATLGEGFMKYLPRARGEDLIAFGRVTGDVLSTMNDKDPQACIQYQFGAGFGQPLGNAKLLELIGTEGQQRQLDTMNALVVNAGPTAVPYDQAKAQEAVNGLVGGLAPILTGNSIDVASGKRPPRDAAEAKAACTFGATLYKNIVAKDAATAELILRHLLAP